MRTFILITLFIGCHSDFFAQNTALFTNAICKSTCSGTLGENIFPDGNFGSGTPNILPGNPGIAPGYNYIQNPPPGDGAYVITNNTSSWGSFATNNWIKIEDNGPEPNGYMMVVNAAFQPGIFYQKNRSGVRKHPLRNVGGCDFDGHKIVGQHAYCPQRRVFY